MTSPTAFRLNHFQKETFTFTSMFTQTGLHLILRWQELVSVKMFWGFSTAARACKKSAITNKLQTRLRSNTNLSPYNTARTRIQYMVATESKYARYSTEQESANRKRAAACATGRNRSWRPRVYSGLHTCL